MTAVRTWTADLGKVCRPLLHAARTWRMVCHVEADSREFERAPLSGDDISRLMRRYRVRIRELSERTGFTMKRIREVRTEGLGDRNAIRDWIQAITGTDPGPM